MLINSELFNLNREYLSKPNLSIKYFFIASIRGSWSETIFIANTGINLDLIKWKDPSPSIKPNNQ